MPEAKTVLVVGGTGDLGGRAVDALLGRGKRVRALVREGTDPSRLAAKGVEIARGDMRDPASLDRAMANVDAVVTTAAGYTRRRKGDSLKTDDIGNRNLVDAAKRAGIRRFVFTSILTCDQAPEVPHFWQKKLIEDYLEASGVPFVSLRPGAFLGGGGAARFFASGLRKGRIMSFGTPTVRWTYIHPDDVARCLALAVDDPRAVGRRIDLGTDRPVSTVELAGVLSALLGRDVRPSSGSVRMFKVVGRVGGLFSPWLRDMMAMGRYFETGKYVADTRVQAELFGPVPTIEDTARRMLADVGLVSTTG